MQGNADFQLKPEIPTDSDHRLEFDFPALHIGIAEYPQGPTGCTVFYFPAGVKTAVDIRGGYPGVSFPYEFNHAICFAGGSLPGLEVVAGVGAELFAARNYEFDDGFPLVSGAIVYDFAQRANHIYPDLALGRAALRHARPGSFLIGAHGAGRNVTVGGTYNDQWSEPAGQGAAFRQVGEVKIAVFTVVNAAGAVHDRQGMVMRGNCNPETGERVPALTILEHHLQQKMEETRRQGNTTLTLVATNLKMSPEELQQLARQVHQAMGRVIQPFATMDDGDVLYAVTTDEVESSLSSVSVGVLASELAWDAILSIYNG